MIGNIYEELVMANMGQRYEELHIKINSKSGPTLRNMEPDCELELHFLSNAFQNMYF